MATSRAFTKLAVPQTGAVLLQQCVTPRLFLQASRRTVAPRPLFGSVQGPVSSQLRRNFASEASVSPPPPKKRRFRKLRWAFRLGYLSVLGGIALVGYNVYMDRHPEPQVEPDPSKKTLVILGKHISV